MKTGSDSPVHVTAYIFYSAKRRILIYGRLTEIWWKLNCKFLLLKLIQMIRAVIIDDERLARNELKKLLQEFPEIEIVAEAANANEGIEKIDSLIPDLIFLDIQMPGKTGFDMLAELDKAPDVIFTTAYDEYALKAFEVNALDYLLKPVEPKRLADALQKLQVEEDKEPISDHNISINRSILNEHDQVFVKDGERCWFVK